MRILFAFEPTLEGTRFIYGSHFFRCRQRKFCAEAACGVIAATLVLSDATIQIFGGADVISACAAQGVRPSDGNVGRPGLEPGTNALKGRCSTN